jgi:hypothetical protein
VIPWRKKENIAHGKEGANAGYVGKLLYMYCKQARIANE